MNNMQAEGIKKLIEAMLPSSNVIISNTDLRNIVDLTIQKRINEFKVVVINDKKIITIYCLYMQTTVMIFRVERQYFEFSNIEEAIINGLKNILYTTSIDADHRNMKVIQNISSSLSLSHILVVKYLRGFNSPTIFVPSFIISKLQELTHVKYEGNFCTSGFIYTSQINKYNQSIISKEDYSYTKFDDAIEIDSDIFNNPTSYRYIDGKNSFYLIDNTFKVHGIIRCKNPQKYSLIDRIAGNHVIPLVEKMPGRVWCAFNGINDDVMIIKQGNVRLHWEHDKWRMLDYKNIEKILLLFGCTYNITEPLIDVIIALSRLKQGALLLIPLENGYTPNIIGRIDNSEINLKLIQILRTETLTSLLDKHSLLNILSSDGMTTISKNGELINCGEIVDLSSVSSHCFNSDLDKVIAGHNEISRIQGGGRSQTALVISQYGLSIKISEDGPVTIYYKKHEVFKI